DEPRAAEVVIQRAGPRGQAQAVLEHAGRRRQEVVRRLSAEEEKIDLLWAAGAAGEQAPRGRAGQVGSTLLGAADPPLPEPGLVGNSLRDPRRKDTRQGFVGEGLFREVVLDGTDGCEHGNALRPPGRRQRPAGPATPPPSDRRRLVCPAGAGRAAYR